MFEGMNFIGDSFYTGDWLYSATNDSAFEAINPATEEVYGIFPLTTKKEVHTAVETAREAFGKWKKESRVKRADYFDKLAQLIKQNHNNLKNAISIETGKNLNESHAEVIEALHMCQVAAAMGRSDYGSVFGSELASKDAYVIRKPRGVVAVISPWNFPAAIGSFWCAAPALVEGNTVVHKPSELTPMVNQIIARLYQEAGFPGGVYNLIHGDGETGKALVESDVDVILFTGSSEVGKLIKQHCATNWNKTCSTECGSKSAMIIFDDGNTNLALEASIASAFKLSGQRCVSSGRILIQRNIFEEFKHEFASKVSELTFGDPFSTPTPMFGPLISKEHMERVSTYNVLALSSSNVKRLSYVAKDVQDRGFFLEPIAYECEWGNELFLKQEVFGPHVALIPFNDIDDAIRIYNDSDYGLALGIVTDDFRKHRKIAQECITGMLYINGGSIGAESHLDFSSWKKSGWGCGAAGTWKAVTHTMAVTTNYEEGKISWAQGMK